MHLYHLLMGIFRSSSETGKLRLRKDGPPGEHLSPMTLTPHWPEQGVPGASDRQEPYPQEGFYSLVITQSVLSGE